MQAICKLYVSYMLAICWLYVGYMLAVCWLYVSYMFKHLNYTKGIQKQLKGM